MKFAAIQRRVVACRACPRLVGYLAGIRRDHPDWWCRPVPALGDPRARIALLGLAPGRAGSNRTGRMFTGDASGRFLFPALERAGLTGRVLITAVVRCAPPANKPAVDEVRRCSAYAMEELDAMPNLRVVVALGRIAHDGYLRALGERLADFPFSHGALHRPRGRAALVDVYHPSRQNTQTGRLTMGMFVRGLRIAGREAGLQRRRHGAPATGPHRPVLRTKYPRL